MKTLFLLGCILCLVSWHSEHSPPSGLVISSVNPNYYEYKGKPTLLISATEHYFSLVNSKFDYNIYLDRLHSLGFNMVSVMSGVFLEPSGQGEWEELIVPWKRSDKEGYRKGGNKFDLSKWDDAYFDRLEKFVSVAESKDILKRLARHSLTKTRYIKPVSDSNYPQGNTIVNGSTQKQLR